MTSVKGWQSVGYVNGEEWEVKQRSKFIMARPANTIPDSNNPDDPHCRIDLDSSGNPIWSTFHSNFSSYFGMQEVVRTAITIALGL